MIGIILAIAILLWLVGIFFIIREWKRDCEEIGKENLAVSLWERIRAFAICFVIPVVVGILMGND
jgi:hypothetical protein